MFFVSSYFVNMKTLSITLIVKNERDNLTRLLPMLTFADEIVVVDTGSTDSTVEVAKRYTDKVYNFAWQDDFSKARNFAISKATCEYIMWLDADDILPAQTRNIIMEWKNSNEYADVYYVKYRMDTAFPFWFWRERIVKRCAQSRFKGFIHEAIVPFGVVQYLDCEVVHKPTASHEQRNLYIYQKAMERRRRFTLRDKFYYARTLIECNQSEKALPLLRDFAKNKLAYVMDRIEAYKLLANHAMQQKDFDGALNYLAKSVQLAPPNGEICCTFGNCYFQQRNYRCATQWYNYALNSRAESGFINEYFVNFLPHIQLSVCLWHLGDKRSAKLHHELAKKVAPYDPTVIKNDKWFNNVYS